MSENIPVKCASCQGDIDRFFEGEVISTHPFSQFKEGNERAATHIFPPGYSGCGKNDTCHRCWSHWRAKEEECERGIRPLTPMEERALRRKTA